MAVEPCPRCGHLHHVYGGERPRHYPGCSLGTPETTDERKPE